MYCANTIRRINDPAIRAAAAAALLAEGYTAPEYGRKVSEGHVDGSQLPPPHAPTSVGGGINEGGSLGHVDDAGGLRGHSLDRETYPWTYSARGTDAGSIEWYVWNALTGQELTTTYTNTADADAACRHARRVERTTTTINALTGRS